MAIIFESVITCPNCQYAKKETMPTDDCVVFYHCKNCEARLGPKDGRCCVFCSYGSVSCPPIQQEGETCGARTGLKWRDRLRR
jgi:hypothetical protein